MAERKVTAVLNSPKKHSVRYDLFIGENRDQQVGSLYWPKILGPAPKELVITIPE